ncbi:hypothetical protein CAPTEDRAFT_189018 [Capitella teleta]|uniref:Uncharacterized protein n=1 Tax=Capitella teleta TaxID=283909 RepID=R7UUS5_CAPTE|nr:hypothetical protein CAPTEDRAFT_189018 [Capitella teleta]|eukprot:ELU07121.1 hypothetical protein CAPTEDRAFT_189018 [Capitella teleta]
MKRVGNPFSLHERLFEMNTMHAVITSQLRDQHDNRGEHDYWERRAGRGGRGRGGRFSSSYRGRGSSFRGRTGSFRDSKKEDTQWKHDKFKELEEEKPSSTTK